MHLRSHKSTSQYSLLYSTIFWGSISVCGVLLLALTEVILCVCLYKIHHLANLILWNLVRVSFAFAKGEFSSSSYYTWHKFLQWHSVITEKKGTLWVAAYCVVSQLCSDLCFILCILKECGIRKLTWNCSSWILNIDLWGNKNQDNVLDLLIRACQTGSMLSCTVASKEYIACKKQVFAVGSPCMQMCLQFEVSLDHYWAELQGAGNLIWLIGTFKTAQPCKEEKRSWCREKHDSS